MFSKQLEDLSACSEAVVWVGEKTLEQAWAECNRGDWMLWLAQKSNVDIKILTLAKVRCASLVKHLMRDERSLEALKVAERFAHGKATRKELADTADAAADAAYAAAAYAAAAVAVAVADAARKDVLEKAADICRETIPAELIAIA